MKSRLNSPTFKFFLLPLLLFRLYHADKSSTFRKDENASNGIDKGSISETKRILTILIKKLLTNGVLNPRIQFSHCRCRCH